MINFQNTELKIKGGFWLTPNLILIGSYPTGLNETETNTNLGRLESLGIKQFIDLTEKGEKTSKGLILPEYKSNLNNQVSYKRFAIRDKTAPTILKMVEILDFIDESISNLKPVYIHCRGGKYRTGTVIGCYLVRHNISTGDQAIGIERLIRRNTHADDLELLPTQIQLIKNWQKNQ